MNPILKSVGLLPADVFRSLGISFPGQPQIVFGPLTAFLLLALFLKTGKAMVFPVIGFLRALSLSFVFPANVEHSGTLLAAIVAGGAAVLLLNNPRWHKAADNDADRPQGSRRIQLFEHRGVWAGGSDRGDPRCLARCW